ncbi:MAG: MarR family winged helix-turn-helix transcriptional regulator [Oceanicoccus sp.]
MVTQLYNEHLAPLGLRVTQFSILKALHLMGTTTALQVQEVLVMEQATVSRALKPLVRDGYIAVNEGVNKREKALSLTPQGKALYQQALAPWNEAQKALKKIVGLGQDELLIELSRKIVAIKR